MSAFARPSAAPAPPLQSPPLRVTPQRPGPRRIWIWGAVVLILALAVLAYVLRSRAAQKVSPAAGIRTTKVVAGPLRTYLRLSGTTAARNYANIMAPRMRGPDAGRDLILIKLAKPGSYVKKGDLVAQIDAQAIRDHADDIDALVQQAEADVRKRKAEQAIEMEDLRQSLRQAKADLEKAKLDNSAAEIRTDIDREQLKLSVEEAEAAYRQLQTDLKTTEERQHAELRILELTRDRHARHRDRHRGDVTKFSITAPINGLVVMTSVWRGGDFGQVEEGEQVRPGQPFMKIVDTSDMILEATINQVESEKIRLGQHVEVGFDAYPGLHVHGKVEAVGALAVGGWRENYYIRNIPVKVAIEGKDDRVIPDLSASADVLLGETDNTLVVPLSAVQYQKAQPVLFVKHGERFEAQRVELGASNNTQAAVASGVSAGDVIALEQPRPLSR